jgi:hypothetical protein
VHVHDADGFVAVDIEVRLAAGWLVVRDSELSRSRSGFDVRGDGLWLSIIDEGDGRWTFGLEAFALAVDDPRDELGERVPLGLDAEYDQGELIGTLLVADGSLELACPATFRIDDA